MYLCLSTQIYMINMHDDLALFLKCKHVDGCSFFELMLQYMCGSRGGKGGPDAPGKSQFLWDSIQISI